MCMAATGGRQEREKRSQQHGFRNKVASPAVSASVPPMLVPAQADRGVDVKSAVGRGAGQACMTPSSEPELKG